MGRYGLMLAVMLVLVACTTQDDEDSAKESASESQHPWKDQENALHKAEQVEQDVLDAFKRRDEEMEKQAQ